jgi:hypothetical protein
MSAVDHSAGRSWTAASSRHETVPRPSGRRPHEVGDLELRLAEELGPAAGLQAEERAQQHADGLARQPADALELGPARVGVEEREQRAQVGEVDQRQAVRVGVVEDEREARLLRLVRAEHLGQELRAEVRHVRTHRHAGPDSAEREELDRERGRRERQAQVGHPIPRPARPARPVRRGRTRRPSRRRRTPARRRRRAARP